MQEQNAGAERLSCSWMLLLLPLLSASPPIDCGRYGANLWSVSLDFIPSARTISWF